VAFALLFGLRRGLFYFSPVLLLGAGALTADARRGGLSAAALGAAAVLLLANSGYYMWWGGAAVAPRHLIPAVGLLGLGLGLALRKRGLWPLYAVLGAASFANALAAAAVGLEAPETGDVLRNYLWPKLLSGQVATLGGASNIGIALGLAPAASLGPVLVWILLGARWLLRVLDETAEQR
jgi:hypothetical protein